MVAGQPKLTRRLRRQHRFVDAAAIYGPPRKGATGAQGDLLTRRLERLTRIYESDRGRRPALRGAAPRGGAASPATIGAASAPGFESSPVRWVSRRRPHGREVVITGEGKLDGTRASTARSSGEYWNGRPRKASTILTVVTAPATEEGTRSAAGPRRRRPLRAHGTSVASRRGVRAAPRYWSKKQPLKPPAKRSPPKLHGRFPASQRGRIATSIDAKSSVSAGELWPNFTRGLGDCVWIGWRAPRTSTGTSSFS